MAAGRIDRGLTNRRPRVGISDGSTTVVVQCYLDDLAGGGPAEPAAHRDQKSASSTIRYRALPDFRRAKAALMLLIGKCSVCGTTLWRAANSSIVSIATGEPVGEPETQRCCAMSENAATGNGSGTTPTTYSLPFGASVPISASQSSFALTVLNSRSKLPPSFPDGRRVLARDDVFRPELSRLVELALARREISHVAAVGHGELHGHVTEAANADNAEPVGRLGVHGQWGENSDASTQERPGIRGIQPIR